MGSLPIVDLLSWGLSPETSGHWPSASGPLCYAPHCGRLYGPLFYWAISYLVFKVDLAPGRTLGRVVTAGGVSLPRFARGRACRACKRPAVERSLVGFCFFQTLFKVEQKNGATCTFPSEWCWNRSMVLRDRLWRVTAREEPNL